MYEVAKVQTKNQPCIPVGLVIPSQTATQKGGNLRTSSRKVSWVRVFPRGKMANEKKVAMPSWVAWWQFISGIICIIDATYIILRPRTMKSQGGDLNWLYSPCKI